MDKKVAPWPPSRSLQIFRSVRASSFAFLQLLGQPFVGSERLVAAATGRRVHGVAVPISKQELATGMYLRSLTPKKELASLLNLRSICLDQAGRKNQGLTCKLYADELLLNPSVVASRPLMPTTKCLLLISPRQNGEQALTSLTGL